MMVSGLNSLIVPALVVLDIAAVPPLVVVVTEVWARANGLSANAVRSASALPKVVMRFISVLYLIGFRTSEVKDRHW